MLDMDGVVNHWAWWDRRPKESEPPPLGATVEQKRHRYAMRQIDPLAVERLNTVVERTGCNVVLSSTWRLGETGLSDTQWQLKLRGARFDLLDRTPNLDSRSAGGLWIGARRGYEIKAWLDDHPGVERFAIVDDDSDMGPLIDRLVKTSMERGILDEHVERLVAMLGEAR